MKTKLEKLAAIGREIESIRAATRARDIRRARRFKQYARERGINPYANPCGLVQS